MSNCLTAAAVALTIELPRSPALSRRAICPRRADRLRALRRRILNLTLIYGEQYRCAFGFRDHEHMGPEHVGPESTAL